MSRCRAEWGDITVVQEGFAIFQHDKAFRQIHLAGADGFDLPSHQGQTGLEFFIEAIFKGRTLVPGNGCRSVCGFFCILLSHRLAIIRSSHQFGIGLEEYFELWAVA